MLTAAVTTLIKTVSDADTKKAVAAKSKPEARVAAPVVAANEAEVTDSGMEDGEIPAQEEGTGAETAPFDIVQYAHLPEEELYRVLHERRKEHNQRRSAQRYLTQEERILAATICRNWPGSGDRMPRSNYASLTSSLWAYWQEKS